MVEKEIYDSHGNVVELQMRYTAQNILEIRRYEKYDDLGNNWIEEVYDNRRRLRHSILYFYREQGIIWRIIIKKPNGQFISHRFFNQRGELEIDRKYDSKGKILTQHQYEYNYQGQMIAHYFRKRGRKVWHYTFAYSSKGQLVEKRIHDHKGRLDWIWRYNYNRTGKEITRELYDSSGLLAERWDFEYSNGQKDYQKRFCPNYSL